LAVSEATDLKKSLIHMNRSITTLVLMGISALIILFILSSFYKVFNRQPIHTQAPIETTKEELSIVESSTELTEEDTATAAESDAETLKIEDLQSEADLVDEIETETTDDEEMEIEVVGEPGDLLHEKPHLQNAVPPVPKAPPSPRGAPVVTSPSEESFSQTGNTSPSTFPKPITVTPVAPQTGGNTGRGASSFPAPIVTTPVPRTTPAPTPAPNRPSSSSSFPAPIIINPGNTGGSSSFPRPQ
jgi:hypothetical protein